MQSYRTFWLRAFLGALTCLALVPLAATPSFATSIPDCHRVPKAQYPGRSGARPGADWRRETSRCGTAGSGRRCNSAGDYRNDTSSSDAAACCRRHGGGARRPAAPAAPAQAAVALAPPADPIIAAVRIKLP